VHVHGPDDVVPVEDRAEALAELVADGGYTP
jgi:hypothetical protein